MIKPGTPANEVTQGLKDYLALSFDFVRTNDVDYSQYRRDCYWRAYIREFDEPVITWAGYDDANFWDNVAILPDWRIRSRAGYHALLAIDTDQVHIYRDRKQPA